MRRNFSQRQKLRLLFRDNFKCRACGTALSWKTFHADHVVPFSKGGATTLVNGQALCCPCNLAKGNKHETPTSTLAATGA